MTEQPPPPYAAGSPWPAPPAYVAAPNWGPLASWGSRVAAYLIDMLLSMIGFVPYIGGFVLIVAGAPSPVTDPTVSGPGPREANTAWILAGVLLAVTGLALMVGIQIWNRAFRQGRTGQSIGKKVMGLMLIDERTGQPMGAMMAFVRDLAHALDGFFYVGFLWPLWDEKRQTFADKVLGTVVIEVPRA